MESLFQFAVYLQVKIVFLITSERSTCTFTYTILETVIES